MDRQVTGRQAVAFLGVQEGHGSAPLTAEGLDEPLGLAVGPWLGGPGSDMA